MVTEVTGARLPATRLPDVIVTRWRRRPVGAGFPLDAHDGANIVRRQVAAVGERPHNVLLKRGSRRLYRRRCGVAPPKDSAQESTPAMYRPEAALEVDGFGVEHGAYQLRAQVVVSRRQVRLQIAHIILDLVVGQWY